MKFIEKPIIAINTNKYLPYSETFIKNHIEGLEHFEPIVFASEKLEVGLKPECQAEFMIKDLKFGRLKDALYKLGVKIPSLVSYLKDKEVKLMHSHFGQNGYASIKLAKEIGVPHITTFHGVDISIDQVDASKHGRLLKKFHEDLITLQEGGDIFIAVSDFIKGKLIERGFKENKIVTNYLGVDTKYFSCDLERSERHDTIICVARHIECKGIEYLISAMSLINQYHPQWRLILVGDGERTEYFKEMVKELDINVEFKGRLSVESVKNELAKSKIYCQPSVKLSNGQEEALALTIVEAQAMGVPAVVFNSGGMPEAIVPGVSGFVVEEKDIKGLANKILSLIEDEQKWNEFSQAAIGHANEHHCFEKQIHKLEIIYKNLIEKRKK